MGTFGNTNTSAVGRSIEGFLFGSVYTCPENLTVDFVKAYLYATLSSKTVKVGIYRHSDLKLIATSNEVSIPTGASAWYTFTLSPSLTSGTEYILMAVSSSGTGVAQLQTENGDLNQSHVVSANEGNPLPDPLGAPTHENYNCCIYVSYTPSVAKAKLILLGHKPHTLWGNVHPKLWQR